MASEAQVVANRSNARKSTGPRTPEGKTAVSQNAVKHGLLAKEAVVRGEDPGEFESYRDQMLGELAPVGQMESVLAERVVSLSWRLQRAERLQTAAFDAMYEEDTTGPLAWTKRALRAKGEPGDDDLILGQMVVADFTHANVLDRLVMYERRIEHSLYGTMAELRRQRLSRELEPPAAGPIQERAAPVYSVPARVSEGIGVQGSGVSDLAPDTRPLTPGAPCGVTTNVPAEDPSCETNPIGPGPSEGQVPCGTEVMNDPSQNGLGKTNPISQGDGPAGWLSPSPPDADPTLRPDCPCFPLAPGAGSGHNERGGLI